MIFHDFVKSAELIVPAKKLGFGRVIASGESKENYAFISAKTVGEIRRKMEQLRKVLAIFVRIESPAIFTECGTNNRISAVYIPPTIRWSKRNIKLLNKPLIILVKEMLNPKFLTYYRRFFKIKNAQICPSFVVCCLFF